MVVRTQLGLSLALGLALLVGNGCLHAQRPVEFAGAAALPFDEVASALLALGLDPAEKDPPQGLIRTRWEDLTFLYGEKEGRDATLFRRYAVVIRPGPASTAVTFRAEMMVCPVGTRPLGGQRLPAVCERLSGILEQHQAELDRLGADLRLALARVKQSRPADGPVPVLVVFDLQAPLGLLPKGATGDLADLLAARLTETGRFRVLPRDQLRQRMKEQVRQGYGEAYGQEFQVELGRALSANKLLTTQILGAGDSCTVAGTVYDLASESAEAAATVQAPCRLERLTEALGQLARKLSDGLR